MQAHASQSPGWPEGLISRQSLEVAPAVRQWPEGEGAMDGRVWGPRVSRATQLWAMRTSWPGLGDRCAPSLSGIASATPTAPPPPSPGGSSFSTRSISGHDRAPVPLGFLSPSQLVCSCPRQPPQHLPPRGQHPGSFCDSFSSTHIQARNWVPGSEQGWGAVRPFHTLHPGPEQGAWHPCALPWPGPPHPHECTRGQLHL